MQLIVTGSLAFDHIMVFQDYFKNHILPDKIHVLNVAFAVENLQKEFGGTAGNIAYTLNLLEANPLLVAVAGKDFLEYANHLNQQKISSQQILILEENYTAQCFITTDLADNQITAFHGGAMLEAHQKSLSFDFVKPSDWLIISPNGKKAMQDYAKFCQQNQINFIFDPGQSLPIFNGAELKELLKQSRLLIVNDYEWELFQSKTGLNLTNIFDFTDNLIITLGEQGSILYTKQKNYKIPAVLVQTPLDPTGCGDAYRAGLLYGLKQNLPLEICAQIGSVAAAFVVEKAGTQKHFFSLQEFQSRYASNFSDTLIF